MFKSPLFLQYLLLVGCWIACIIGYLMEIYSAEIIPIVSMILIVGGIIINKQTYTCGGS